MGFFNSSRGQTSVSLLTTANCAYSSLRADFMQKEKSRQVVKQLLTVCIADMFPALHWVTVIYINIFFSSNFPVRWAICSEVWNCSKQGFTVCPHSVSARGEQIFLIAQAGLRRFCWCKVEIRILFLSFFFPATLLCRSTISWCHETVQFLLPGGVTDTICSTFICFRVLTLAF